MADFGDFENNFGAAPVNSGSGVPTYEHEGYGSMPADNGLPLDDTVFTTTEYDSSVPAAPLSYPSFDAPANPFDAPPANPFDSPVKTASFSAEPEPVDEDPRTAWYRKNSEVLALKDQAERAAKQELVVKAQAHLESVYQTRKQTLQAKRDMNREAEKIATGSLPAGETPWERVTSVINFNFDAHSQDVSRYKSLLITCKTNNVPVRSNQSSILAVEPAAEPIVPLVA